MPAPRALVGRQGGAWRSALTREETFNVICTLLEEGGEIEMVSMRLLEALETIGEDLLDHLDPPVGLRRWLESHGLSLVVTSEITPPQIWEAIQGEAVETVEEELEVDAAPVLQTGDHVEYQTAISGPRGQSQIGSGRVVQIGPDDDAVVVETGPNQYVWIDAARDFIRVVT